jgi:hypothetical protein
MPETWQAACEYKQKEIDILKNHDIAGYEEGIAMISNKDKEAFEKWFKDFYEVDFNAGNPRFMGQSIAWKYACEYKDKEFLNGSVLKALNEKYENEFEKSKILVEALEKLSLYVSYNGDTWVKDRATEALNKYRGES